MAFSMPAIFPIEEIKGIDVLQACWWWRGVVEVRRCSAFLCDVVHRLCAENFSACEGIGGTDGS
jgi:hypothetical protein